MNPYPKFDLETVKTPLTYPAIGHYPDRNVIETSDQIIRQIHGKKFDIALMGCGIYSMPIVDYLQSIGKSHIVLGGMMQMYFGIRGRRYETEFFQQFMNEHWIRPIEKPDIPKEHFEGETEALGAHF